MTSELLKTLLGPEMSEVDRVLRASLDSDVALIRQVAEYIVGGGGKRLRPALVLLSAQACGYDGPHPRCCTTMSSMNPSCGAGTQLPMPRSATPHRSW